MTNLFKQRRKISVFEPQMTS